MKKLSDFTKRMGIMNARICGDILRSDLTCTEKEFKEFSKFISEIIEEINELSTDLIELEKLKLVIDFKSDYNEGLEVLCCRMSDYMRYAIKCCISADLKCDPEHVVEFTDLIDETRDGLESMREDCLILEELRLSLKIFKR